MIQRAFKTSIIPTNKQLRLLRKIAIVSQFIYNDTITDFKNKRFQQISYQKLTGKKKNIKLPSYTDFKRKRYWIDNIKNISQYKREACDDAKNAFKRFFSKISAFPKYKNKKSNKKFSIRQPQTIKLIDQKGLGYATHIRLPCLGKLKLKEQDYIPIPIEITKIGAKNQPIITTNVISASLSLYADKWYISIAMHLHKPTKPTLKGTQGLDPGLRTLAYLSDGTNYSLSDQQKTEIDKSDRKIAKLNKELSRRYRKGLSNKDQSKNYFKTKIELQRAYSRKTNILKSFKHKISKEIADKNLQQLNLEGTAIKNLMKNKRVATSFQTIGLGEFKQMLIYKCKARGTRVFEVPRTYPSTQICYKCNNTKGKNKSKKQNSGIMYHCKQCNSYHHRDLGAAINIKNCSQQLLVEL